MYNMELEVRVLLVSNSTVYGCGYLDHVEEQIRRFLGRVKRVLFFPFALFDRDRYVDTARRRFATMGYALESAHAADDPAKAVEQAEAIFLGGANTFRLLKALQDLE